jgi:hypothetical protein
VLRTLSWAGLGTPKGAGGACQGIEGGAAHAKWGGLGMPKGLVVLVRGIEGAEPLAGAWGAPPDTKHTYISFFILGHSWSEKEPVTSHVFPTGMGGNTGFANCALGTNMECQASGTYKHMTNHEAR